MHAKTKARKPSRACRPLIRGALAGRELIASLAGRTGVTRVVWTGGLVADGGAGLPAMVQTTSGRQ